MKRLLVNMSDVEQVMEGLGFDTWGVCGIYYWGEKDLADRIWARSFVDGLSNQATVMMEKMIDMHEGLTRVFVVIGL